MHTRLLFPKEDYVDFDIQTSDTDVDIRNYHSKAVKVRKDCTCCYCGYPIKKNEYALAFSAVVDDEWGYGHYCMGCVEDDLSFTRGWISRDLMFENFVRRFDESHGYERPNLF